MTAEFMELPTPPPPPRHRWLAWVAWLLILGFVGFAIAGREWMVRSPAVRAAEQEGGLELITVELQARYLVGVKQILGNLQQNPKDADFAKQAQGINVGPLSQRLRAIATISEVAGPQAALDATHELRDLVAEHQANLSDENRSVIAIYEKLWAEPDDHLERAKSLTEQERTVLEERLGWFGRLVEHPAGTDEAERTAVLAPARSAAIGILAGFFGAIALGLVGFAGLIVFLTRAGLGILIRGFHTGSPNGRIYVETFALWLLLYPALSLAAGFLTPILGMPLGAALAMFGSLVILAWPVLRGVPWSQVRQDIGWTAPRNGWLEPIWGLFAYVTTMPWLAIGLIITLLLILLQRHLTGNAGGDGDPFYAPPSSAHPILVPLFHGGAYERFTIFFLASIAAPIVEETMFRGVFYRHLREASRRWRLLTSFVFSAGVSSLIFAAVHPQGWVAIPVLAALAFGFCIAREWRGSLIACMIAHGLSNGIVLLIAIAALSGG